MLACGLLAGFIGTSVTSLRAESADTRAPEHLERILRGRITDAATGAGLSGASITLKGASTSVLTDATGNFSLTIPDDRAVIVVSFIGYSSQEITVGNRASVDVRLQSASSDLTQVVVMGYGTQSKRDVTGAVKSVKAEAFNRGIVNNPQQLIQGKVAGVNVVSASGEPGASNGITIRGPGGVRTGSTPLFVVDGIPLDNSGTGNGDPLNFINPADIESMDVLKDASATAIYGARGANGVILITTRKGKAGTSTMNYSTSLGLSKIARKLPVFDAADFRARVKEVGGTLDDKGGNTDWQDEIFRTGFTQNHNLTMSGGADRITYFASFGLQKQEGILKTNDMDRYSARFNATQKFWDDRLVVDVNLSANNTKQKRPNIGSAIGDAISKPTA